MDDYEFHANLPGFLPDSECSPELMSYSRSGYDELNSRMRSGRTLGHYQHKLNAILAQMSELCDDVTSDELYRSILIHQDDTHSFIKGNEIEFKSLTSTSTSSEIAYDFNQPGYGEDRYFLSINMTKGIKGIIFNNYECEVLLEPGLKAIVDDVYEDDTYDDMYDDLPEEAKYKNYYVTITIIK